MNSEKKNPLSEHIKEVLLEHEEPYTLGSWERFRRHKNRKAKVRRQRLFMAVAASIVLILLFAFAWKNIESIPGEQVAENRSENSPNAIENTSPSTSELKNVPLPENSTNEHPENEVAVNEKTGTRDKGLKESGTENFNRSVETVSRKSLQQYMPGDSGLLTTADVPYRMPGVLQAAGSNQPDEPKSDPPGANIIVQNEDIRYLQDPDRRKELAFSIAYAPVMNIHDSQTDLGTGGGFYTDWNFARNMTISSGLFIAQNRLKYDNGQERRVTIDLAQEGPTTTASAENLTSVQIELVNLEIPLNLRYSLTDHLSVSAGISSMAFLKEQYSYNFEYEQRIQVFSENTTGGLQPASRVVKMRTSQTQSEPTLTRMNWAAFYTFSVGFQQEIFKRYTASLEPFIKIPAGDVTSRGISYTSGGLQFKISF